MLPSNPNGSENGSDKHNKSYNKEHSVLRVNGGNEIGDTEPKRVKAYVLENNEWKDTGTGFCVGKIESQILNGEQVICAYLIVNDEDSPGEVILRSKLEGNIEYQRQEETLIVWKDLSGRDIALSFEESVGCDALCDFIVEVQRHLESNISLVAVKSNDNGIGSVHEIITGPVVLPSRDIEQNERTLTESLRILNENISFEFLKNETIEFVLQTDYIGLLIEHFHKAEKEKLIKDLFLLGCIIKTLFLYNQRDVLEQMVEDDKIYGIVGILEYDTEYPGYKANHRKCLESYNPSNKEVIPIDNEDLKLIVKKCFRLLLLKDVVLVRFLDDHNFHLILDIILDLQTCIIGFLQMDPCLDRLMDLYDKNKDNDENILAKRQDGIKMLHQCVQMSKDLDPVDKSNFYKTLVRKKLFKLLDYAFHVETNSGLRIMATDTIVTIIEHDILLIHNVQNETLDIRETDGDTTCRNNLFKGVENSETSRGQESTMDMSLLLILSTILLTDKSPGLKEQVAQALHTLLHPDGFLSGDNENENSPSSLNDENEMVTYGMQKETVDERDINDNHSKRSYFHIMDYFSNFYKQVAPILFKPLIKAEKSDQKKSKDDNLLIHIVKLLSFICTEHDRRMSREFVLESGLLGSVSELIKPHYSLQLRLTAVRCFKNIMCLDDEYYHRCMISNELYGPIFELLQENSNKDNLANSCIQDFFKIIAINCLISKDDYAVDSTSLPFRTTNFLLLNRHLIETYGDALKDVTDIKFLSDMFHCYEEQLTAGGGKTRNKQEENTHQRMNTVEETRVYKRSRSLSNTSDNSDPSGEDVRQFEHSSAAFKKAFDNINTVEPPSAMLSELMRE